METNGSMDLRHKALELIITDALSLAGQKCLEDDGSGPIFAFA